MRLVPTLQAMASDADLDVKSIAQVAFANTTEALNAKN
jgi:hypothetical protein